MNSPCNGSAAVRIFLILIAALFLIGMITSTAAAVPNSVTSDGNYWYQTITINSDTAETNGLYHVWVPFPYDWSNGLHSYRFYNSQGVSVPFHIFSSDGHNLSLSFKTNLEEGDNLFYLSGGNESLGSVQSTSIYGQYLNDATLNANISYSTPAYNFGQIKGGVLANRGNNSFNFYGPSASNVSHNVIYGGSNTAHLNSSAGAATVNSTEFWYYDTNRVALYAYVDSVTPSSGTNLYSIVIPYARYLSSNATSFAENFNSNSTTFSGTSIRYYKTAAGDNVANFSYAVGFYSKYNSVDISDPIPKSNSTFVAVQLIHPFFGETIRYSSDQGFNWTFPAAQYYVNSSNAGANWTRTSPYIGTPAHDLDWNYTVPSGSVSGKFFNSTSLTLLDLRTAVKILPEYPLSINATGMNNLTNIPQLENAHTLSITPYFSHNITAAYNPLFVQVIDLTGRSVPSVDVEQYLNGIQLTGNGITGKSGIILFNAINGTSYTIFANKTSYSANTTNVVAKNGTANVSYAFVVLEQYHNISINVKDYDTLETINVFTTYLGETQRLKSTDNGTVEYTNVTAGVHDVVLVAEGYNQVSRKITVDQDNTHFILYMTKSSGGGGGSEQITTPQYITFYIRNQINSPISGALIEIYEKGADSDDVMMSKTTGSDGAATFSFNRTLEYRVVVTKDGVQATHNISGSQNSFFTIYLKMPASVALLPANQVTSASISVSKYNDSSSGYAALLTLRIRSTNGGTISINPSSISGSVNLQQISTNQTNTTYTVVYGITETQLKSFRENNFRIHYSGQATNSLGTGTFNFNVSYQFRIGGEGLLSIELPSNIKQGLAIGAALMILLAVVSVSTISLSYTSFLVTLVVGRWIGWVELHELIWVFLALGLVLAVIYDMRVGVNS